MEPQGSVLFRYRREWGYRALPADLLRRSAECPGLIALRRSARRREARETAKEFPPTIVNDGSGLQGIFARLHRKAVWSRGILRGSRELFFGTKRWPREIAVTVEK